MNAAATSHPTQAELTLFNQGRLAPQRQSELELHISDCQECCRTLRQLPDDTLLMRVRGANTPADGAQTSEWGLSAAAEETEGGIPAELADHPRYRVVRPLGRGGMGIVYEAEHRLMDRPVALKVISRRLTSNPRAVERFRREVKAAARLSHPNIVVAHDAEQAGDLHFLVMEYVDGVSLARQVEKRGPLSVVHACHFARQAALGLQNAFEHGMVHRDIKPQNLMLTRKGQIKILDFGLARLAQAEEPLAADAAGKTLEAAQGLTLDGVVLGTPDYIAPEQVSDSRQVDTRADIYSLGCTLYFMLAAQPPFPQGTVSEKVMSHINRTPRPLGKLRAEAPRGLVDVIEKMMAKDPAARYQTPNEVAQALAPFCKAPPPLAELAPQPLDALSFSPPGMAGAPLGRPAETRGASHPLGGPVGNPLGAGAMGGSALGGAWKQTPLGWGAARPRPTLAQQTRQFWRAHGIKLAATLVGLSLLAGAAMTAPGLVRLAFNRIPQNPAEYAGPAPDGTAPDGTAPDETLLAAPAPPSVDEKREGRNRFQMAAAPAAGVATGKRLLLVVPPQFWYSDYEPLARVLPENGIAVTVATPGMVLAQPMGQDGHAGKQPVSPSIAYESAQASDYDAIAFIGGMIEPYLPDGAAGDATARLIRDMLSQDKYVTSICRGNAVLAMSVDLSDRTVAGNSYTPESPAARIDWTQSAYVMDGKVITARDAGNAEEFAHKLATVLSQ